MQLRAPECPPWSWALSARIPIPRVSQIPAQIHQPSPRCAPKSHFLVLANATSSPWTSKHKSSAYIPRCLYNLPSPAHQSLQPVASFFITSRHPSRPFYFAAHGSTQAAVSLFVILGFFFSGHERRHSRNRLNLSIQPPLLPSDADGPLSLESQGVGICRKRREPPGMGVSGYTKDRAFNTAFLSRSRASRGCSGRRAQRQGLIDGLGSR